MNNVIDVKNLSFGYEKDADVLHDISFSVPEGAYVAIIGHNGSGKSTLAKILIGLLNDFRGEVSLFGVPLNRDSLVELRSRVGIVFQNPDNQFVGSTVADDIAFGLENKRVPHAEMQRIIEEYAKAAGMEEFLDHEPVSLSGGQKQRVAIAGVLAMKPDLVIFDEATAMLDPKGRREIASLVSSIKEKNPNITILSITHDVEEAAKADYVLVIDSGKIAFQGTPNEVFSHGEELSKLRLGIPFAYSLRDELRKRGIAVPDDVTTLKQLEDYLW